MSTVDDAKKDQRAIFLIGLLFGLIPVFGHALIAFLVELRLISTPNSLPFLDQNWLGHLSLAGISVSLASFINFIRHRQRPRRDVMISFAALVLFTTLLWIFFSVLAVSGGGVTVPVWRLGGGLIVMVVLLAYIVDMRIAAADGAGGAHAA